MIMLNDKGVRPIVAVAKNENQCYCVTNIVPKEAGSIASTEYNIFAKRFAEFLVEFSRQNRVPLRISPVIETLELTQIITSPIARMFFSAYLAMYPRSHHPSDIKRLDKFICVASRFCRKRINLDQLEGYLRSKLQWSDEDARWCRQRIKTGLEILRVYKALS